MFFRRPPNAFSTTQRKLTRVCSNKLVFSFPGIPSAGHMLTWTEPESKGPRGRAKDVRGVLWFTDVWPPASHYTCYNNSMEGLQTLACRYFYPHTPAKCTGRETRPCVSSIAMLILLCQPSQLRVTHDAFEIAFSPGKIHSCWWEAGVPTESS